MDRNMNTNKTDADRKDGEMDRLKDQKKNK